MINWWLFSAVWFFIKVNIVCCRAQYMRCTIPLVLKITDIVYYNLSSFYQTRIRRLIDIKVWNQGAIIIHFQTKAGSWCYHTLLKETVVYRKIGFLLFITDNKYSTKINTSDNETDYNGTTAVISMSPMKKSFTMK